MTVIEHSEIVAGTADSLFELTQDYSVRVRWDPFPESYEFHPPFDGPAVGAVLTVHARNGQAMTVRYVSFNKPRAAAIEMVSGPWFISRFAGTWSFKPVSCSETRVTFRYNMVAGPRWLAWIIQPFLDRSFLGHARRRLGALSRYAVRSSAGEL